MFKNCNFFILIFTHSQFHRFFIIYQKKNIEYFIYYFIYSLVNMEMNFKINIKV